MQTPVEISEVISQSQKVLSGDFLLLSLLLFLSTSGCQVVKFISSGTNVDPGGGGVGRKFRRAAVAELNGMLWLVGVVGRDGG